MVMQNKPKIAANNNKAENQFVILVMLKRKGKERRGRGVNRLIYYVL
jgi:hypothetical protein